MNILVLDLSLWYKVTIPGFILKKTFSRPWSLAVLSSTWPDKSDTQKVMSDLPMLNLPCQKVMSYLPTLIVIQTFIYLYLIQIFQIWKKLMHYKILKKNLFLLGIEYLIHFKAVFKCIYHYGTN